MAYKSNDNAKPPQQPGGASPTPPPRRSQASAPCRTTYKGGNPPRNLNPWKGK